MAINYHKYSAKRRTIMQQVRRVEKKHFKVAEKYHMPTVNELKKMPLAEQRKIIRQSQGFTTSGVRKSAYSFAGISTKTGKLKKIKVKYTKRKKSRKPFTHKEHYRPPYNPPSIGDLMEEKMRAIIAKYNMLDSTIGRRIQRWLDDADRDGMIDRLSLFTEEMLTDFDSDIRYLSQGKIPRGDGISALHWALTRRGFTAEQWQDIQDDMDSDADVSRFDEESFYGNYEE